MISTKKELEEKVLEYSPQIRERISRGDARAQSELERIADETYAEYKPFISGASQKVSSIGRVLGYAGDLVFFGSAFAAAFNPLLSAYMLTGLLLKKGQVAAQLPEAVKSIKYGIKTGDYLGMARNVGAKVLSYVPGTTILDRGLSRISQKRLIRKTAYEVNKSLEEKGDSWYVRSQKDAEEAGYTNVRDRSENIVGPSRDLNKRDLKRAA